jgi:hypothetical protein
MNNPTEQDSQVPTHDEPPPKQYATEQSASAAPRGKDESSPKIPGRVESGIERPAGGESAADDEDEESSAKGTPNGGQKGASRSQGGTNRPASADPTTQGGQGDAREGSGAEQRSSSGGSDHNKGSSGGASPQE